MTKAGDYPIVICDGCDCPLEEIDGVWMTYPVTDDDAFCHDGEPHQPRPAVWTSEDADAAGAEGWDVFDSDGSVSGPWQIQKIDDMEVFKSDEDVWIHVWAHAQEGTFYQRALQFVAVNNPPEYAAILRCVVTRWLEGLGEVTGLAAIWKGTE